MLKMNQIKVNFWSMLVTPRNARNPLLVSPPEPPVVIPPIRPQDIEVAVCGAEKMAVNREEINQRIAKSGTDGWKNRNSLGFTETRWLIRILFFVLHENII